MHGGCQGCFSLFDRPNDRPSAVHQPDASWARHFRYRTGLAEKPFSSSFVTCRLFFLIIFHIIHGYVSSVWWGSLQVSKTCFVYKMYPTLNALGLYTSAERITAFYSSTSARNLGIRILLFCLGSGASPGWRRLSTALTLQRKDKGPSSAELKLCLQAEIGLYFCVVSERVLERASILSEERT